MVLQVKKSNKLNNMARKKMSLLEWKEKNKKSYKQMAEESGLALQTIFEVVTEGKGRDTKLNTIIKIHKYTGLSLEEIIGEY